MSATKQVEAARLALMSALYRQQVGQKIKKRREQLGLKQHELAEMVGVQVREIPRWENGHSLGRAENLEKVAGALDLTIQELMGNIKAENKRATTKEQISKMSAEIKELNQRIVNLEQTVIALLSGNRESALARLEQVVGDARQDHTPGHTPNLSKPASTSAQ